MDNNKHQLHQQRKIVESTAYEVDRRQAAYDRKQRLLEAHSARVQSDITRVMLLCLVVIGVLLTLLFVVLALIGVIGNLHTFIATSNGVIKTVLNWVLPVLCIALLAVLGPRAIQGMLGIGYQFRQQTHLKEEIENLKAERVRLNEMNQAHVALIHSEATVNEAEAARKRAEATELEARARHLLLTLPPDHFGNVFYRDPVTGKVELIASPNFNPNFGLSSIHMHNTAMPGTTVTEEKPGRPLALAAPQSIPPMYDLMEAYQQVDIGPHRILLGRSDRGDYLTVDDGKLCHGVFTAITGRGKSMVERGIASQLMHAGHLITWLDLKFASLTENGLDYRPLAKKLWDQRPMRILINGSIYEVPHVVRNEGDIAAVLHWLAYDEMQRRLLLRDAGDFSYPSHYVFLEEMLAFIKIYPAAAEDVVRIIALGRELRIKLFTAAQNFLAKDTKLTGGAKENFETAYFLGGDTYSGAKVLDVTQKDLNEYLVRYHVELGQGLTLLRNNTAAPQATLTRVGMASNEAIYYHHGRADDFRLPPRTELYTPLARIVPTIEGTLSALPSILEKKHLHRGLGTVPGTRSPRPAIPEQGGNERHTAPLPKTILGPLPEQQAHRAEPLVLDTPKSAEEEQKPSYTSEDLLLNANQRRMFVHLYCLKGYSIKECLERIPSEKRPGAFLSYRRYQRHASHLVKQHRLERGSGQLPDTL